MISELYIGLAVPTFNKAMHEGACSLAARNFYLMMKSTLESIVHLQDSNNVCKRTYLTCKGVEAN